MSLEAYTKIVALLSLLDRGERVRVIHLLLASKEVADEVFDGYGFCEDCDERAGEPQHNEGHD